MLTNKIAIIVLCASFLCCLYLLTLLARLRHIHHLSRAWSFIFTGLALLTLECGIGIHLSLKYTKPLDIEQVIFLSIIFVKAMCYAVGFTIWKHDLSFSYVRHEETLTMEDQQPDHPTPDDPHPPTSPPGQPPVRPQDDPVPEPPPNPGDVPGPGKNG